jgi:multidrug resistance efflux pump
MLVLLSLADAGSHVKKGQMVAEFDRQYQVLRRDDYNDSVIQLNANIKKMKVDLAEAKEAHDHQLRSAKAAYDKALLDLKTIEVRSAIEAENFRLNAQEAKAQYEQVLSEVKLLEESQRAQIKASEIDRDQAKIELQRAENNVERMITRAPIDGIVVMQSIFRGGDFGQIKQGDQVYSGQFFMSIVDPRSMVLNGTVNQVDAEKLRLGAKARIRFDAYPDMELPGTVVGVGAMAKVSIFRANYVADIPVRVKLDRVEPRVIPDLTASAEIILRSEKESVIAPRAGVFEENGSPFVFLQSPAGWIRKEVDIGLSNHVAVSVRSGLQKGDVIALQRPL